jgi:hypothetical protein
VNPPEKLSTKWTPSSAVKTHAGNSIPQDILFFCQPPPEIGTIISAYSTAQKGKHFRSPAIMFLTLGGIVASSAVLGLILNADSGVKPIYNGGWLLWLPIAALFIYFKFIDRLFPGSFECTFVGEQGWARESIDLRSQVRKTQLQYSQCRELFNELWYYYRSGRTKGPNYKLRWFDSSNQEVGSLSEYADSGNRLPPDGQILHFVLAAEKSWTRYIAPNAQTQLQTRGSVAFYIKAPDRKGNYSIRLTTTGVNVLYEDTNITLRYSEIEPIKTFHEDFGTGGKQECFIIQKKGVEKHKWGQTTVTIQFSEVANVQLLLNLLDKGLNVV